MIGGDDPIMTATSTTPGWLTTLVRVGFVLSILDLATDIAATYHFNQALGDYGSNADDMISDISGEAASNYKSDSAWFTALSAEYDSLSTFDKEYVYCDVSDIQSDPSSLYDESERIFHAACFVVIISAVALCCGYCAICCLVNNGDMDSRKEVNRKRERKWFLLTSSANVLFGPGPQLAIIWLKVVRMGGLSGFECQEKFYTCGASGTCGMGDLMVPVALNSSLLDLITADSVFAASFFAGSLDVSWNFFAGFVMYWMTGITSYLVKASLLFCLTTLPLVWTVYIDVIVPSDREVETEGIVAIGFTAAALCCFAYVACSKWCCSAEEPIVEVQTVGPYDDDQFDEEATGKKEPRQEFYMLLNELFTTASGGGVNIMNEEDYNTLLIWTEALAKRFDMDFDRREHRTFEEAQTDGYVSFDNFLETALNLDREESEPYDEEEYGCCC